MESTKVIIVKGKKKARFNDERAIKRDLSGKISVKVKKVSKPKVRIKAKTAMGSLDLMVQEVEVNLANKFKKEQKRANENIKKVLSDYKLEFSKKLKDKEDKLNEKFRKTTISLDNSYKKQKVELLKEVGKQRLELVQRRQQNDDLLKQKQNKLVEKARRLEIQLKNISDDNAELQRKELQKKYAQDFITKIKTQLDRLVKKEFKDKVDAEARKLDQKYDARSKEHRRLIQEELDKNFNLKFKDHKVVVQAQLHKHFGEKLRIAMQKKEKEFQQAITTLDLKEEKIILDYNSKENSILRSYAGKEKVLKKAFEAKQRMLIAQHQAAARAMGLRLQKKEQEFDKMKKSLMSDVSKRERILDTDAITLDKFYKKKERQMVGIFRAKDATQKKNFLKRHTQLKTRYEYKSSQLREETSARRAEFKRKDAELSERETVLHQEILRQIGAEEDKMLGMINEKLNLKANEFDEMFTDIQIAVMKHMEYKIAEEFAQVKDKIKKEFRIPSKQKFDATILLKKLFS